MACAVWFSGASAQELAAEGPQSFEATPENAASPFGGLSLAPTRVVLDPSSPSEQVTLYNTGSAPVTYRAELIEFEALVDGGYAPVEGEATPAWSAARWLRYAPRQWTLEPGERQAIRVLARAPRDTPAGEYRSHLRFSTIPTVDPVDEDEPADIDPDDREINIKVGLEYGVTIPVILRTGEVEGGAEISQAELTPATGDAPAQVAVTLTRTGNRSDYGMVRLLDAEGDEAGLLRGVAVFPPLTERRVTIPVGGEGVPVLAVYETELRRGVPDIRLAEAPITTSP